MTAQPAHAKLSPSSASRWMICPGSVAASEGLPDETSEFAAEGTMAHAISDDCLMLGFDAFDFVGQKFHIEGHTFTWDEDDAELLQPGIDWTRAQPGTFYGEFKVDLSYWLGPNQFGTSDRGIVAPDLITTSDLKWGRGIPVSPVRNKQLMLYSLGFWKKYASHITDRSFPFRIIIDQPRCSGGGGEWNTTLGELLDFGEEARAAALRAAEPNAPRVASKDGCLWCKVREHVGCDTYDQFNLDLIQQQFDDLDSGEIALPTSRQMTPLRRSTVLLHRKMIETWLDDLHAETMRAAKAGEPTDGLKAVEGRKGPDKWLDKEAADTGLATLIGDKRFTKRLISPAQAAKVVPVGQIDSLDKLIQRGERKPILVPEDDARPAIKSFVDMFDDD